MTRQLLLTEAEAAARMRLCQRTLRKARKAGTLHYVLIGRAVRYTEQDLETFIDSLRTVQPQCQPKSAPAKSAKPARKSGVIVPFTVRNAAR